MNVFHGRYNGEGVHNNLGERESRRKIFTDELEIRRKMALPMFKFIPIWTNEGVI